MVVIVVVVIVVVVILVAVIAVTILKGGAFTPFKMQSGETETDPYCQFLDPDIFSQKLTFFNSFWIQKLMFCVSFWVQKLIHNISFWLISAYHVIVDLMGDFLDSDF